MKTWTPPRIPQAARPVVGLLTAVVSALALAATPGGADPDASGREQLGREARLWLSTLTGQPANRMALSQLDARIQVAECDQPWTFDLPFGPGQALRARCRRPSQQVFLLTQSVRHPGMVGTLGAPSRAEPAQPADAAQLKPTTAWVLAESVGVRTPLNARHLVQAEVSSQLLREDQVTDPDSLEYMESNRALKAGTPLRKSDLRPIKLVKRGDLVSVSVEPVRGLRVEARLEATEDGVLGQRIRLKNPQSGRFTMAQVTGPGLATGL